jgi:hypothetical protein
MSDITAEMEMELENELVQLAPAHEMESEEEYEDEDEGEGEEEYEDESEDESEYEGELEGEGEAEAEMEQESFFNHLATMADRGGRSQALRRIGLAAARQAMRSYQKDPPASVQGESELEDEATLEMEAEANPLMATHANAMMEHLSHEAASAESEEEAAEQFLPLIPLAAKFLLPKLASLGAKALPILSRKLAPHLTRGVSQVARTLFRSKATRPLLRTMPNIAKRTVATLARHAAKGHTVTPRTALRTLARHTAHTLSSPRHAVRAFHRSRALDRRYHVATRRFVGRPTTHGSAHHGVAHGHRHPGAPGHHRRIRHGHHRFGRAHHPHHGTRLHHRYGRPGLRGPGYWRGGPWGQGGPRPAGHYGSARPIAAGAPVRSGRRYFRGASSAHRSGPCLCFRPVSCGSCPNCGR